MFNIGFNKLSGYITGNLQSFRDSPALSHQTLDTVAGGKITAFLQLLDVNINQNLRHNNHTLLYDNKEYINPQKETRKIPKDSPFSAFGLNPLLFAFRHYLLRKT